MNYDTTLEWHKALLVLIAQRLQPASYLELGCRTDPAFLHLSAFCKAVTGVDRDQALYTKPSNATIYQMTTDEFFLMFGKTIAPPDLVLIDACHERHQVLRDFENVRAICADNALVVFHDTANNSYVDPLLCDNSYLAAQDIVERGFELVTLPFPPGISICRPKPVSLVSVL